MGWKQRLDDFRPGDIVRFTMPQSLNPGRDVMVMVMVMAIVMVMARVMVMVMVIVMAMVMVIVMAKGTGMAALAAAEMGMGMKKVVAMATVMVMVMVMVMAFVADDKRRHDVVEGLVLKRRNRNLGSSFVVRSYVDGLGVEHTLPLYSPWIRDFKVLKRGRVRRAKLYYVRDRGASMLT